MPKIKVKNIPDATYKRICTNCIKCSRLYCFQFDVMNTPNGYVSYHRDVVELSEQEFPTNREWMNSLSNEELAELLTTGLLMIDKEDVLVAKIQCAGTISCNSLNVCCFTDITSNAASTTKSASVQISFVPVVAGPVDVAGYTLILLGLVASDDICAIRLPASSRQIPLLSPVTLVAKLVTVPSSVIFNILVRPYSAA